MPKMKTHKGSAKRFRRTGTGKIMRAKAFKSHILTKKSQKHIDRKSTRLNSSHLLISYAVFCLKKKKAVTE